MGDMLPITYRFLLKFKLINMKTKLLVFLIFIGQVLVAQESFSEKLSGAAISLTNQEVTYDPTYFSINYPNGDIPNDKGVCTDVIIRAYRKLGIDLQKEVHEDMKAHFLAYPNLWGLSSTDKNIDHRRVPNLMKFFSRNGQELIITRNAKDYQPGDIVSWNLNSGLMHIGIVVNKKSSDEERYLIVHNIGAGQVMEDVLFSYKIIGHYRYQPNLN